MSEMKIINLKTEKPASEKQKKRVSWKKIVLFCVVALLILGILAVVFLDEALNLDKVRRFFSYLTVDKKTYGQYSFEASSSNAYAGFDEGMAIASQTGISVYAASGERVGTVQTSLTTPCIAAADDFVVGYDVGGTTVTMADRTGKKIYSEAAAGILMDLDAVPDGYVLYAACGNGYKTELVAMNTEQKVFYRWGSNTQYFNCCAMAYDGEMIAAVALGQEDTEFASTAVLIHTDEKEIYRQASLGSQVIYELKFFSDGSLCAIGENSTIILDSKGKLLGSYEYTDEYLTDYSIGEDTVVLSINQYASGNGYRAVAIRDDGKIISEKEMQSAINGISVCGKYICVLTGQEMTVYNREMKQYARTENADAAGGVIMRGDGTVLMIGTGRGKIFFP